MSLKRLWKGIHLCEWEFFNRQHFHIEPVETADIWRRYHWFPAKWHLRNECRNSILMTRHYPDLGSASDWSCRVGNLIQPIRSTTQIWVVTRHQCGISALVSKTSFGGETTGSVAKCGLFSQAISYSPFCILYTAAPSPKTKSQWRGGCTGLPFC